jgi:short-subunit dehydrogenase
MTQKSILVTGTSSGIGRHLVGYLADRDFHIFACVRKREDFKKFTDLENVTPIILDVTKPEEISGAVELVSNYDSDLVGIVNNAGAGRYGLLPTFSDEDMHLVLDVNTLGPWRVTNAFLPLLFKTKGRVVNISSQGGMFTSKLLGPYTMSKWAAEAYSDTLRDEVEQFGIKVSAVQPGAIVSAIGQNSQAGQQKMFEQTLGEPSPAQLQFEEEVRILQARIESKSPPFNENEPESATNRKNSDPIIVSEAIYDALTAEKPKRRYLVGTRWEGMRVLNNLVQRLVDENDNSVHNLSRDELVALLDNHLEELENSQ